MFYAGRRRRHMIEDCANYEAVKLAILKCYEPEAYRQRFRGHRKAEDQTCVEFANQKAGYFERWSSSKGIREDYDKLNNTYRGVQKLYVRLSKGISE